MGVLFSIGSGPEAKPSDAFSGLKFRKNRNSRLQISGEMISLFESMDKDGNGMLDEAGFPLGPLAWVGAETNEAGFRPPLRHWGQFGEETDGTCFNLALTWL